MQIYSFSVNYTNFQDFFFHFSPQKEELFRQNKGQKEELFRNMQKERNHHYGNYALSTYKHKTLR